MLAALGRFDDLADDAKLFELAVAKGGLPSPPEMRKLAANDFGRFFLDQGKRAHRFWTDYVRPHWKYWLGGTALAAVMLAPDEFLDAAGKLTEQGFKKLGELGGEALVGVLRGAVKGGGKGIKDGIRKTVPEVVKTFFGDLWGILAFALLLLAVAIVVPFTRRTGVRMLSWLFGRRSR